jgi:hypothetical protein
LLRHVEYVHCTFLRIKDYVLNLYRQVLAEEQAQVKTGDKAQFGYLPRMTLANIDVMNAESFCERTLSCASLIVTDLHTSLSREDVRMLTILRIQRCSNCLKKIDISI